jgi:hypothetical protein
LSHSFHGAEGISEKAQARRAILSGNSEMLYLKANGEQAREDIKDS